MLLRHCRTSPCHTHMPDSPCNSAFPCISRIFPEDRIIYCKVKSTHHFYPFPKRFRHKIVQARRPWADLLPKRLVWPSALIEIEMTSLKRCHVKSNIIVWTLFILGKIWFRVKLEWCQLQSPQKISLSRKGSGVHHHIWYQYDDFAEYRILFWCGEQSMTGCSCSKSE